jgi:hypothetical protein
MGKILPDGTSSILRKESPALFLAKWGNQLLIFTIKINVVRCSRTKSAIFNRMVTIRFKYRGHRAVYTLEHARGSNTPGPSIHPQSMNYPFSSQGASYIYSIPSLHPTNCLDKPARSAFA